MHTSFIVLSMKIRTSIDKIKSDLMTPTTALLEIERSRTPMTMTMTMIKPLPCFEAQNQKRPPGCSFFVGAAQNCVRRNVDVAVEKATKDMADRCGFDIRGQGRGRGGRGTTSTRTDRLVQVAARMDSRLSIMRPSISHATSS